MINEQELSEAVDRLREGDDNGLLVKHDEVLLAMRTNSFLTSTILVKLSEYDNDIQVYFDEKFNESATDLLREAIRAKQEVDNGLQ